MLTIHFVLFLYSQNLTLWRAVPCLRWSVTSLSLWRPGFSPKPVHVEFAVDRVVLQHAFSEYFNFGLSLSFHQCSIVIHSSIVDTMYSLQLTALLNNTLKIHCGHCWYTVLLAIFLLGVALQNMYCLNRECALFQGHCHLLSSLFWLCMGDKKSMVTCMSFLPSLLTCITH